METNTTGQPSGRALASRSDSCIKGNDFEVIEILEQEKRMANQPEFMHSHQSQAVPTNLIPQNFQICNPYLYGVIGENRVLIVFMTI